MLAEVPTHEDQARKWVSTWSEERCIVRHRWISQDGKACLLASWFLSRDVAVHSGVVGASAPAPRCFKFRRKTRPGDPGGTTTADATVWQNPCSAAGGLCVVQEHIQQPTVWPSYCIAACAAPNGGGSTAGKQYALPLMLAHLDKTQWGTSPPPPRLTVATATPLRRPPHALQVHRGSSAPLLFMRACRQAP